LTYFVKFSVLAPCCATWAQWACCAIATTSRRA